MQNWNKKRDKNLLFWRSHSYVDRDLQKKKVFTLFSNQRAARGFNSFSKSGPSCEIIAHPCIISCSLIANETQGSVFSIKKYSNVHFLLNFRISSSAFLFLVSLEFAESAIVERWINWDKLRFKFAKLLHVGYRMIELDKINKYGERKIHEDKKCA